MGTKPEARRLLAARAETVVMGCCSSSGDALLCRRRVAALQTEALDQPRRLTLALGAVGRRTVAFLGYPCGDEAEQRRPLTRRALDHGVPLLERRRGAERELVRAVGAPARVGVPQLVPHRHLAQQAAARGH